MALRILHILSSNFFAGSVAYAISLSEKQASEGHSVYMITDSAGLSDKFSCIQLPVSDRTMMQRFKNIRFLKKFIKAHQIQVVHAHSRAASWIAYYAVGDSKIAYVSTIHGRQVKHSSLKKMDVFGEWIIGICPNLISQLREEMQFDSDKLVYIPNGFNIEEIQKYKRIRQDGKIIISVIGRFNGPKGENIAGLLTDVFPRLLQENPSLCIQLIGGEWDCFSKEGKKAFGELKIKYNRIDYLGFSDNVYPLIADSDLLIGAGRVAIEGLISEIPVFALGEVCCHGMLTQSNIEHAISSNFGDILPGKSLYQLNFYDILKQLQFFIQNPQSFRFNFNDYIEDYDFKHVFPKIMHIYKTALMQKAYSGTIPVLMYHKIPDEKINSQHRIFVPKKKFENHLKFFKFRGLTSIMFKDYLAFANGDRPISEFPKKPFILTFDDGYEDNYRNMLPLTEKYGFKGVLFLPGDFSITRNNWDIGENPEDNQLMTSEQKKSFVNAGWEIGAHTLSHADLTRLPNDQAIVEIEEGKIRLEEELKTKIISFAYPYGIYNDHLKVMVEKSGFEFGISTDTGGMFIESDRFAIFRVNMFPEESFFQLYKKTSSWYRAYYRRKRGA